MKKKLLALILCLLISGTSLGAEPGAVGGYDASDGYTWVTLGRYPASASGEEAPILWRVLTAEGDTAFLLSEYILDSRPVQTDRDTFTSWEKSDLYAWLNGAFSDAAFTSAERALLRENPADGALVTLLSAEEVRSAAFGLEDNASHRAEGTAYARAQGLDSYSGRVRYSPWWLRDPSADQAFQQRRVIEEGKLGRTGVHSRTTGVRPALWADLSAAVIASGTGEKDDPFVLTAESGVPVSTAAPAETASPAPETAPASEVPPETGPTPEAPEGEPTPVPGETPADADASPNPPAEVIASVEGISPLFPALAEDGFLPGGAEEFVFADEDGGIWLYASQTLRVEIRRVQEKSPKLMRWYEAEIWCKPEEDMFTTYAYDESRYTRSSLLTDPGSIARQHHLVFAMNTDFFIYRVARQKEVNYTYPIGIVIRRGNLMYDVPKKPNSTVYPPLDVCALYPDGDVRLFLNAAVTGRDLIADGAQDALSFGPILVEDGEISPRASAYGDVDNPRTAFGMVERGHYYCVLLEGRLASTYSEGGSCIWMAETMKRLGCSRAINLDGGQTACMIFMGERINKIGTYSGSATNKDRPQNEVLGIGISEQVQ